ncbi:hypothetical protein OR1_03072 [Geobacter sp. OR-1]|uniref:hypothetical protein n=1 Tax=Geobacter sp. OR-1 TaxID=1266765 RepID=UPI000543E9F8|nr:hypothetical protein [Geobacter sp. OR-1]GAM10775.1 hypothetical protein OR1_03072 [Geobacter sp. OR-1]
MKLYLFDPGNGVYEGETFDESGIIDINDGATTLAPPAYAHGQVPVFDRQKNEWTVARSVLPGYCLITAP